jgi:hypothetical protein
MPPAPRAGLRFSRDRETLGYNQDEAERPIIFAPRAQISKEFSIPWRFPPRNYARA